MQTTLTKPASQPQQSFKQKQLFPLIKTLVLKRSIVTTSHARIRMCQRSIKLKQVMDILNNPIQLIAVEYSIKNKSYTYKIVGGEHNTTVVLGISNKKLIIVTVY